MATWAEFSAAAPALAERGERLLRRGGYIGTVAADGSPRVHPVTPLINGGRLFVFVGRATVKFANLRRDPRFALHAPLGESDEEFVVPGRVVAADDPDSEALAWEAARAIGMVSKNHLLMEFLPASVHWAVWEALGTPDIRRVSERWSDPEG